MMVSRDWVAPLVLAASLVTVTPSLAATATDVRTILARHDPEHRIDHTSIQRLGSIRVAKSTFAIYLLNFTNPVSKHGQRRIAIIKGGLTFLGSQQCTLLDAKHVKIDRDRVRVTMDGLKSVIRFRDRRAMPDRFFCGEEGGWEQII